jgi:hypothetical protein
MLETALSIAPIFAVLMLGFALRRGGIPSAEFWNLNDRLVYWVLMPALLFHKTSTTEFDAALVGAYGLVLLGALAAAIAFGTLAPRLAGLGRAAASSVMQGAARHNTFIALAVAERLHGAEGLAIAALASAMLIPATNLSVVTLMVGMLSGARGASLLPAILRDLARNPFLLAVALGVALNLAVGARVPVLHDVTGILGAAALPIMLLSVGASLRMTGLAGDALAIALSAAGKLLVFPLAILGLGAGVGLSGAELAVAMVFGAAPTASSAYTLARQMGGDAELMATIITLQTILAFATMPVTLALL